MESLVDYDGSPSDEVQAYSERYSHLIERDWRSIANFLFLRAFEDKTRDADNLARNAAACAESKSDLMRDVAIVEDIINLPAVEHPLGELEAEKAADYVKHPKAREIIGIYSGHWTVNRVFDSNGIDNTVVYRKKDYATFLDTYAGYELEDVPAIDLDKLVRGAIDPNLN